ncbi:hypothetical protein MLD38_001642 [Melastoma candidum]|uniref:Uncharacterized protein n=1 Tax=Melastoma candidum TaxID=119954 RepID=A0ACB9SDW8_9MYRT|nr:hypothetical protein MLD38_001642 [Melastoma candidum]
MIFRILLHLCGEEFDEEKEPDGMLLLGWNQAPPTEKDNNNHVINGVSTSAEQPSEEVVDDVDMEISEVAPAKKRKVLDTPVDTNNKKKVEEVNDDDEDDDVIMLEGNNPEYGKKRKLI